MKQSILLDNQLFELDRARSWPGDTFGGWNYAHSRALICPKCLSQWAILAFEGDEILHPQGAFCAAHGDGRLLLEFGAIDLPLLAAMPEPLLKRELILTINRLENENG